MINTIPYEISDIFGYIEYLATSYATKLKANIIGHDLWFLMFKGYDSSVLL